MNQEIRLRIVGRHCRDGIWEETVTEATGKYYKKDGVIYLFYEEGDQGAGICKTRMTLRERCMQVSRQGAVNTLLTYEMNQPNTTQYYTPLGVFDLETQATHYIVAEKENELTVDLGYFISMNGDARQEASLRVTASSL